MLDALLLSDDLMDASRVTTQARAEGRSVRQVRTWKELLTAFANESPGCLLLDLHHAELQLDELMKVVAKSGKSVRVIGFGSHVDAARLKAARQAGVAPVMPRSQFFEEVQTELKNWLAP